MDKEMVGKHIVWCKSIKNCVERGDYIRASWQLGASFAFLNGDDATPTSDRILDCVSEASTIFLDNYGPCSFDDSGSTMTLGKDENMQKFMGCINMALNELRVMDI